jgi:hypothetical protein
MDKYIEELMNDIYLEEKAINIGSTSNRIKNYDRGENNSNSGCHLI